MVAMLKTVAAGAIALTVAGAGFALAQSTTPREMPRWRMSTQDVAAYADARIAALKAGLKLTAEQEKHWPAVETAVRDFAKQRADRMRQRAERRAERREARRAGGDDVRGQTDTIARLRRGADALATRADALKRLADAAAPLYQSLDDGQKRRFSVLLRMGGRFGGGNRHGHWQRRADNAR
jgi:hypothetical protein